MIHALPTPQSLAPLDSPIPMRDLKEAGTAHMVVPRLDGREDLGLVRGRETVGGRERRGEVGERKVSEGTAVRILRTWLVLCEYACAAGTHS